MAETEKERKTREKAEDAEIDKIGADPYLVKHGKALDDYGIDQAERDKIDGFGLVIDYLQDDARSMVGGSPKYLGYAFFVAALNTDIVMDFTTEMGGCTGMYWSYVFQMPKWAFNVAKVDESMEVSPVHTEAFNQYVNTRQRLEGQIKQGLQSAAQAVTDYELLSHDSRRYKEILDYFKESRQAGDEHVLRSLFVDRVDAHTGEGYSMITMAKRWPTIITDFIRMGQKKHMGTKWDPQKVMQELDVSQAEATVLLTKDRLFQKWKELFRPTVAERYSRIQAMVDARKKSIEDYKKWLRPYVVRHRMMKESSESGAGLVNNSFAAPAIGGQYAFSSVRLWTWKAFPIGEKRKPDARTEADIHGVRWMIDPYDDLVKEWAKKIEYKYRLKPGTFDEKKVRELLKKWATKKEPLQAEGAVTKMVPSELYYVIFDHKIDRSVIKVPPPAGGEAEDFMINPLRTWIASQNVMMIHLLELEAREMAFTNELDEMLGTKNIEDRYLKESRQLLKGSPKEKEKKPNPAKRAVDSAKDKYAWVKRKMHPFRKYFFKEGPYESAFYERVVKMYLVEVGGLYGQQVNFWKSKAGVK